MRPVSGARGSLDRPVCLRRHPSRTPRAQTRAHFGQFRQKSLCAVLQTRARVPPTELERSRPSPAAFSSWQVPGPGSEANPTGSRITLSRGESDGRLPWLAPTAAGSPLHSAGGSQSFHAAFQEALEGDRPASRVRFASGRRDVSEHEAVAHDDLAECAGDGAPEDWPAVDKGVELAVFPAGVDLGW